MAEPKLCYNYGKPEHLKKKTAEPLSKGERQDCVLSVGKDIIGPEIVAQ